MIKIFLSYSLCLTLLAGSPALARTAARFNHSPFQPVVNETIRAVAENASPAKDNSVQILNNGKEALRLRVHLIRHATKRIDIQTFIWTNDEVGRFMMYELIEAAKRGVNVRILADHFVSHRDPEIIAFLATAHSNLKIKHYRPAAGQIKPSKISVFLKTLFQFKALNQRMHNKVMIVDGVAAVTGGRNIENTYYNLSTELNFKDRDIFVIGPVVEQIARSFNAFWSFKHSVASQELKDVAAIIKQNDFNRYDTCESFYTGGLCENTAKYPDSDPAIQNIADRMIRVKHVEFIADNPGKNRALWLRGNGAMTKRLMQILQKAEKEIIVQSPYFVLNNAARKFFEKVKKNRPDLHMVVSTNSFGSTDNTAAYSANYRLRSCYIEALALDVFEYMPHPGNLADVFPSFPEMAARAAGKIRNGEQTRKPFLCIHAKSLVVDDHIACIGSYNLDPRSQNLNSEVGLIIEDERVAKMLKADILKDCRPENSWVIARKKLPLSADTLNGLIEGLMRLSPVDLWPIRNTSSFALRTGKAPVAPDHPEFYINYEDVGSFPGSPPGLSPKEITTRIYKAVGGMATPLL